MKRYSARFLPVVILSAALIPAGVGCAASPGGDPSAPAVRINDQEIPLSEFQTYLKASFGEDLPPIEDSRTQSQLLDQFIEERLLLQLAEARKIQVEEALVDEYLAGLGAGTETGPMGRPVDAALREQIRRNLLIQHFKDQVLLREVRVAPEEVEAYYGEHPGEFRESRAVVLRQILLEDPEVAKRILAILREDPEKFQAQAELHSASPDKGQPRPYEEQDLPEAMRGVIFALSPGQASDVVEDGGKYRIFQVVEKHDGKNQTLEEVREKLEHMLLQRKANEALSRAISEVKRDSRITVHAENLPFTYEGEYGG